MKDSQPTEEMGSDTKEKSNDIILEVRHLKKHFFLTSSVVMQKVAGIIKAVDDVSFSIRRGETLGLVGESGCGKTTTGRCILHLDRPTSGEVIFGGKNLTRMPVAELRLIRPKIQVIFQDPFSSLNPRMTIGQIVGEGPSVYKLVKNRRDLRERVASLLSIVGLNPSMESRYPHELSGGQRQRVGVARALSMEASFIICDEPVSALDVSIRAQILILLRSMQERLGLTYLFIGHDLAIVKYMSAVVGVMYFGRMVEIGPANELLRRPLHPYTRRLVAVASMTEPLGHHRLTGELPNPLDPPSGCHFRMRCPYATEMCVAQVPPLRDTGRQHHVACHYFEDIERGTKAETGPQSMSADAATPSS